MRVVRQRDNPVAVQSVNFINAIQYAYARSDWQMLSAAGRELLQIRRAHR